MRTIVIMAAGIGLTVAGAATAQNAKNTPEGIICAMTGSCDAPAASGDRMAVGNEKAFSLARPSSSTTTTTSTTTARPSTATAVRPRANAVRRVASAPKVRPGGGLDMLVNFRLGSSDLTPQAQAETRAFAKAMAAPQMQGMRFLVEGHTDAIGAHDRNVALSQARAQSVVDYLVSQGVDPSRVTAKGYGPDRPIRGTRATAPANRRVEFVRQL